MKIETITLKPGSIILWNEDSLLNKVKNMILGRSVKFNKCAICQSKMNWVINLVKPLNNKNVKVLEPKKPYSKLEQEMLTEALKNCGSLLQEIEKLAVVNIVRPETVDMSDITLDNLLKNKYYKVTW